MKFLIDTDLTIEGTSIAIDGAKLSDDRKVASVTFYADAPNKKYNDDGYIAISVTSFDDEGNRKTERYSKSNDCDNITPIGIQDNVVFEESDVIRFLDNAIDQEKKLLVDSIIEHCATNKIACQDANVLFNRTINSLKDKALDLGISSEDA